MKEWWKKFYEVAKDFATKYPAVLSGYIIYSYLFITIMHYFLKVKDEGVMNFYDIFETFDAIPFMWLLAVALVKVIEIRTKLHESEKQRLLTLQDIQMKQTQLITMHEVAKGLQHRINNPLAIMTLTIDQLRREEIANPNLEPHLNSLDDSVQKIAHAIVEFSKAQVYQIENIGGPVGNIATPKGPS